MGNWAGRRGEMQRLQTPAPDFVEFPTGTAIHRFLIFSSHNWMKSSRNVRKKKKTMILENPNRLGAPRPDAVRTHVLLI